MKNQMETVTFLPMVLSHDAQLLVKDGKHPECQTRRKHYCALNKSLSDHLRVSSVLNCTGDTEIQSSASVLPVFTTISDAEI